MALEISGYVEPGTYVGEVNTNAAISIATVPDVLAIVAPGNRKKRVTNEAVKRGQVMNESLTITGSGPYVATLVDRGDRRVSNTNVYRTLSGQTIELPATALSYIAAQLTGNAAGPFDISTPKAIGLQLDTGTEIVIQLSYNAAPGAPVITGQLVSVQAAFSGTAGNAATLAQVATALCGGLVAATSLGYGTAYATAITTATAGLVITSQRSDQFSDVKVSVPFANNATALFGFTAPVSARTILAIDPAFYNALATYIIDYVALNTSMDPLTNIATRIIRTGSFANVTSFSNLTDYVLNSGVISCAANTSATLLGANSSPFDLHTNSMIRLAFDGHAAVNCDLVAQSPAPPGYAAPASSSAATAAEIAKNINAIFAVAAGYGPKYRALASVSSGRVLLTSPNMGISSSVELAAPVSNDATNTIFGIVGSQLPYTVIGTGVQPVVGTVYFCTYEFDRPISDYNLPKRFYSEAAMIQDLTPVSASNLLSVYGQIAFQNNAPSIICCQVNDLSTPGYPSVNEVEAAIDGMIASSTATDILVADTRLNVQTYLMSHVEVQSSPTERNYRVGWFGMPIGTAIGDKDTPDTYVFRAAVTLQVSPDSPARGRLNLVAPDSVLRTITNEDGTTTDLTMDSTAVACAVAAVHTSHTSPAMSLASQTITGFDVPSFPLFGSGERKQLGGNGVLLIKGNSGTLEVMDPVTTEMGGGKLAKYGYRSCISQKDNVSRAVQQAVDTNLRGKVPNDLSDFIFDIKVTVGGTITGMIGSGAIGPFRDQSGASRDINLASDVQAQQSVNDPTKFYFKYWYYLRYPALRFLGEFSVDNPFT